jgi:hypothetical protein
LLLPYLARERRGLADDLGDALATDMAATRVLNDVVVEPGRIAGAA